MKLADCLRARGAPPLTPPIKEEDDAYAVVCFASFNGGVFEPVEDSELPDPWWPCLLSPAPLALLLVGVRGVDCIQQRMIIRKYQLKKELWRGSWGRGWKSVCDVPEFESSVYTRERKKKKKKSLDNYSIQNSVSLSISLLLVPCRSSRRSTSMSSLVPCHSRPV